MENMNTSKTASALESVIRAADANFWDLTDDERGALRSAVAELASLRQQLTTAHAEGRAEGLREAAAVVARSSARSCWPDTVQTLVDCREEILALAARGGEVGRG